MYIPYHLEAEAVAEDVPLSLQNVAESEAEAEYFIDSGSFDSACIQNPGSDIYTVYTGSQPTQSLRNIDIPDSELTPVGELLVALFAEINDEAGLRWRKSFNPLAADETVRQTTWRDSVPAVATQLLSRLIRRHPFPNANHRTTLALVAVYLSEATGCDFEDSLHPSLLTESSLNTFIRESTRLVTANRNQELFRELAAVGVDGVTRRDGLTITFSDEVLRANLEREHRAQCQGLIRMWGSECDVDDAMQMTDDGFRAFKDRVDAATYNESEIASAFAGLQD